MYVNNIALLQIHFIIHGKQSNCATQGEWNLGQFTFLRHSNLMIYIQIDNNYGENSESLESRWAGFAALLKKPINTHRMRTETHTLH